MPPQSRSQRRRQGTRQQRPAARRPNAEAVSQTATTGPTIALESSAPAARAPRRVLSRSAPEPVDYSKDYRAVRRDLRWIALWTLLLFIVMIALKFSGLV